MRERVYDVPLRNAKDDDVVSTLMLLSLLMQMPLPSLGLSSLLVVPCGCCYCQISYVSLFAVCIFFSRLLMLVCCGFVLLLFRGFYLFIFF